MLNVNDIFNFSKRPKTSEFEVKTSENTNNSLGFITVNGINILSKKINFDDESKININILRQIQAYEYLQKSQKEKLLDLHKTFNDIEKEFKSLIKTIKESQDLHLAQGIDGILKSYKLLGQFKFEGTKNYVWYTESDPTKFKPHGIKDLIEAFVKKQDKFTETIQQKFPSYPNNKQLKDVKQTIEDLEQTIEEEKKSFQKTMENVKKQIKMKFCETLTTHEKPKNAQTKEIQLEKFLQLRCDALVCYLCKEDTEFDKKISNKIINTARFCLKNNEQKALRNNIMYIIKTSWNFSYQHKVHSVKAQEASHNISYTFQITQPGLSQTLLENIKRCTSLSANDYIEILNYFKDKNLEEKEKQLYIQIINQAAGKADKIPSDKKRKTIENKQLVKYIEETAEDNNIYIMLDDDALTHVECIEAIKLYHHNSITETKEERKKYKNNTIPINILNSGVLYVIPRKLGWLFVDFRDIKTPAISTLIVFQSKGIFQKLVNSLKEKKYTFLEQESEESYKTINLPKEIFAEKFHEIEKASIKSYIKNKKKDDIDNKTMLIIKHYINCYPHPKTKKLIHKPNFNDTALARIHVYKCGKHYLDVNSKNTYNYIKEGVCIKQSNNFLTNKERDNEKIVKDEFKAKTLQTDAHKSAITTSLKKFIEWKHQPITKATIGKNLEDISAKRYPNDATKQKILQQCLDEKNLIKQILAIYTKDNDIVIWKTNAGKGMVICNISENKQYLLGDHGFAQIPSGAIKIDSPNFISKNTSQLHHWAKRSKITDKRLTHDLASMLDQKLIELNSYKLTLLIQELMKYNTNIIEFEDEGFNNYIILVTRIAKDISKTNLHDRKQALELISRTKIQYKDNKNVVDLYEDIAKWHVVRLIVEKNYDEILSLIQKKCVIQYQAYNSEILENRIVIDDQLILQLVTHEQSNWYRYNYHKKFKNAEKQTQLIEKLSKNIDEELFKEHESQKNQTECKWNFKEDKIFTLILDSAKYKKDRETFELEVVNSILSNILAKETQDINIIAKNILFIFREKVKYQNIFKTYTQPDVSSNNAKTLNKMIKLIATLSYEWNLEEITLLATNILQKKFAEKTQPPIDDIITICIKYAKALLTNKNFDDLVLRINEIAEKNINLFDKFIDELLKILPEVNNVITENETNQKVSNKIDKLIDTIDDSENASHKLQSLVNLLGNENQQQKYQANCMIAELINAVKNNNFDKKSSQYTKLFNADYSIANKNHIQKIQTIINTFLPDPKQFDKLEILIKLGTEEQKQTFSTYQKLTTAVKSLSIGNWAKFSTELKDIPLGKISEEYKQNLKKAFLQEINNLPKISSAIDAEKCNNITIICKSIDVKLTVVAQSLLSILRAYTSTTKLEDKNSVNIVVSCYNMLQQLNLNKKTIKAEADIRINMLLPYYLWRENATNIKENIDNILKNFHTEKEDEMDMDYDKFCKAGMLAYLDNNPEIQECIMKYITKYVIKSYDYKNLKIDSTNFINENKKKVKKYVAIDNNVAVDSNNDENKITVFHRNLKNSKSKESPETGIKKQAKMLPTLYTFYRKNNKLPYLSILLRIQFDKTMKSTKENKKLHDTFSLSYNLAELNEHDIQNLFKEKAEDFANLVIEAGTAKNILKLPPSYTFCKQIRPLLHANSVKLASYDKAILDLTILCEEAAFSENYNLTNKNKHIEFYHAVIEDIFAIIKKDAVDIQANNPFKNSNDQVKRNAMIILYSVKLDDHLQKKLDFLNDLDAAITIIDKLSRTVKNNLDQLNLIPSYTCCKLLLTMLDVANSHNIKITSSVKTSCANLFHQLNQLIYKYAETYSLVLKEKKHDISLLKKFYEDAAQDGTVSFSYKYKWSKARFSEKAVESCFTNVNNSLVLTCKQVNKEQSKNGYAPDQLFFKSASNKISSLEVFDKSLYGNKLFNEIAKKSWEKPLLLQYSILYLLKQLPNKDGLDLYYKFFTHCNLSKFATSNKLPEKYKELQKLVTKLENNIQQKL